MSNYDNDKGPSFIAEFFVNTYNSVVLGLQTTIPDKGKNLDGDIYKNEDPFQEVKLDFLAVNTTNNFFERNGNKGLLSGYMATKATYWCHIVPGGKFLDREARKIPEDVLNAIFTGTLYIYEVQKLKKFLEKRKKYYPSEYKEGEEGSQGMVILRDLLNKEPWMIKRNISKIIENHPEIKTILEDKFLTPVLIEE